MFVATRAEIDDFESTAAELFEENVFRFEIAMNDPVSVEIFETEENGVGKFLDQGQAETLELVLFDEFVEIDGEKFKRETDVVTEVEVVEEVDYIVGVVSVLFPQVFQDPDLFVGLSVEPPFIADYLQCHVLLGLVVVGLQNLSETPLS